MTTSEYKGISVFTDKGFILPDLYAQAVIGAHPTVYGCAVPNGKGGLSIEHMAKPIDLSHLRKAEKAFENFHTLHFFGQFPKDPIDGSIQPFIILKNHTSNQPILAATLVGDFSPHDKTGSKLPGTTWAYTKLLGMMQRVWRLCKEDVNALHEELKTMDGEIKDLIGMQGGAINLFLAKADESVIMYYGKSLPTYKKFPWGTTTDVLGYVTGIVETKPTETKNAKPVAQDIVFEDDEEVLIETAAPESKEAPEIETNQAVKGEDKGKLPIIAKSLRQIVLASGAVCHEHVDDKGVARWFYNVPPQISKRKLIKRALKEASGRDVSDRDADSRIAVIVKNPNMLEEISKRLAEMQAIGITSPIGSDAPRVKPTETPEKPQERKEEKPKEPDVKASVHEDRVYPEGGTPIYSSMSPKAKYDVTHALKALDKNGQSILNPALGQELENTAPQFYKDIGYPNIDETFGWDWDTRVLLAKHSPEAMAIWSGDLIRRITNMQKDIDSLLFDETSKSKKTQAA